MKRTLLAAGLSLLLIGGIASAAQYTGTNGPDNETGTSNDDHFDMKAGNDDAEGRAGADEMEMGDDKDTAIGEAGWDDIYGKGGSDKKESNGAVKGLSGNDGADFIEGGDGEDLVKAGGGGHNETVRGNEGNGDFVDAVDDTFNSGDTVAGGPGSDDQCIIDYGYDIERSLDNVDESCEEVYANYVYGFPVR